MILSTTTKGPTNMLYYNEITFYGEADLIKELDEIMTSGDEPQLMNLHPVPGLLTYDEKKRTPWRAIGSFQSQAWFKSRADRMDPEKGKRWYRAAENAWNNELDNQFEAFRLYGFTTKEQWCTQQWGCEREMYTSTYQVAPDNSAITITGDTVGDAPHRFIENVTRIFYLHDVDHRFVSDAGAVIGYTGVSGGMFFRDIEVFDLGFDFDFDAPDAGLFYSATVGAKWEALETSAFSSPPQPLFG